MGLAATIRVIDDAGERRYDERRIIEKPSTLRRANNLAMDVVVHDLSSAGCRVALRQKLDLGAIVELGLASAGRSKARVVRQGEDSYGCEFLEPLTPAALANAFRHDTVAHWPLGDAWRVEQPDDASWQEPKWPGAVRVAIILGGAALAWTLTLSLL